MYDVSELRARDVWAKVSPCKLALTTQMHIKVTKYYIAQSVVKKEQDRINANCDKVVKNNRF